VHAHIKKLGRNTQRIAGRLGCLPLGRATGLLMLLRKPTRETAGKTSFSSSTRLPLSSLVKALKPVTLPPGCARLATTPTPSGSPIAAMTTGMVVVACLAASAAGVPRVMMTSTGKRTSSAASAAKAFGAAVSGAVLDGYALPFDVAECAQPATERIEIGGIGAF